MAKNLSDRLKILLNSKRSVFRTGDLQSLWQENSRNTITIARRMVSRKLIIKLAKGYYSLDSSYNYYELANLIAAPSYVSFNTALFYWGACFQLSSEVRSIALINYRKKIKDQAFSYQAMKKKLFFNLEGINIKNNISIASPERALLDSFYFGTTANIDDWDKINRTYLLELAGIYPKTVQNKAGKLNL